MGSWPSVASSTDSLPLPPLRTSGRHILAGDEPVVLRGVNRSGLEYAEPAGDRGFLDSACLTEDDLREMTNRWGANVVRLPFNQDFALNGRSGRSAEDYLCAIDRVVGWAAASGAYTILDLQWLDADTPRGRHADGTINRVPALPDAGSLEVWGRLAARYRRHPAVLFDVFNEPHDPMLDDLVPLEGIDEDGVIRRLPSRHVGMEEWQPWAHRLIEVIREEHPEALVFVSGVAWAFDLRGFPLRDRAGAPLANVVYSTHVYPWSRTGLVRLRPHEREWERAFGHLAREQPVFVGEWGGVGHLAWGRRLERYLRTRGLGWAAWGWADWPRLVANCRTGDYTTTAFGEIVREGLLKGSIQPRQ
jgi:endoglucanase